tara:strand:- start:5107 stop:6102 length:996 start_codon:yes stop_codon:yes gene_type:complete
MATATYPTDATLNALSFASTAVVTYTADGTRTAFNLGESINFKGEAIVQFDGVIQNPKQYTLGNAASTITFATAPSNGLKVKLTSITLPDRFTTIRSFPTTLIQSYGLAATTVDSNSYAINGKTVDFRIPAGSEDVSGEDSLEVVIQGVPQPNEAFIFPSGNAALSTVTVRIANSVSTSLAATVANAYTAAQIDQLSIRAFFSQKNKDFLNSMEDRKPDRGNEINKTFDVITFESQAGYEKRRLRSRRPKRQFSLEYTNVSGLEKDAIENFYNARQGIFESFFFEMTHINQLGTLITRFDGPLDISHNHSLDGTKQNNFYTVGFALKEVFD